MTVEERHTYVAHSCKLMSGLVGQEFLINKLSWNQLDLVYGVCGSVELRWWKEHVNVTAGSEVGSVTKWINEKQQREEEEGSVRKEEVRARNACKQEERAWTKEFLAREKEGIQRRKEERALVKELTVEEHRACKNARERERKRLRREERALEKNAPTNDYLNSLGGSGNGGMMNEGYHDQQEQRAVPENDMTDEEITMMAMRAAQYYNTDTSIKEVYGISRQGPPSDVILCSLSQFRNNSRHQNRMTVDTSSPNLHGRQDSSSGRLPPFGSPDPDDAASLRGVRIAGSEEMCLSVNDDEYNRLITRGGGNRGGSGGASSGNANAGVGRGIGGSSNESTSGAAPSASTVVSRTESNKQRNDCGITVTLNFTLHNGKSSSSRSGG
jgi:hypothetical protein